ncbi:MAG: aldo/keto reductase [Gammaproteobacteria bacterium]|nr:aldo/keto reductase [Gammaproteobacteria bacterium]
MQYRNLGQSDLKISLTGLGTMTWGFQNTLAQGFEQMDYAIDQGINFFDTAEMYAIPPTKETYGSTETIIGSWFASRKNRDKVVLATKISGPGMGWIRNGSNRLDKKNISLAIESSLKRLQTDYIDLYQLHWPNRDFYHFGKTWGFSPKHDVVAIEANFIEILETLQKFIVAGKIRHIGLSNESAWGTMKYLQLAKEMNLPRIASIQNEFSLVCRYFEPDLSEVAIQEQCGLLAWSPLSRGALSGKYLNGARPKGSRLTIETRPDHRAHPQTEIAISKYVDLARRYKIDPCQMAIAFVNQQKFVTSTLIGATSMEQLQNNVEAINLQLNDEILKEIELIRREHPLPY